MRIEHANEQQTLPPKASRPSTFSSSHTHCIDSDNLIPQLLPDCCIWLAVGGIDDDSTATSRCIALEVVISLLVKNREFLDFVGRDKNVEAAHRQKIQLGL